MVALNNTRVVRAGVRTTRECVGFAAVPSLQRGALGVFVCEYVARYVKRTLTHCLRAPLMLQRRSASAPQLKANQLIINQRRIF